MFEDYNDMISVEELCYSYVSAETRLMSFCAATEYKYFVTDGTG